MEELNRRFGALSFVDLETSRSRVRFSWILIVQILLLAATVVTTTVFGFAAVTSFAQGRPLDIERIFDGYSRIWHGDARVWVGLEFSAPLLAILMAHEMGHYLSAAHWHVDASLPYFLPFPTLFGTLGAFIRIRSPIYSRDSLFDIGASGPFAGFVTLLPFLTIGIAKSRVIHGSAGPFVFGSPAILRAAEWLRFPGATPASISLHPIGMAAWVGLLATAINLLPIGQSDGGHILYAALGARWHRIVSTVLVAALVGMGFFYSAWWIWAAVMFFFGRRHPLVYDTAPLDRRRALLSAGTLILFLLSISLVPVYIR